MQLRSECCPVLLHSLTDKRTMFWRYYTSFAGTSNCRLVLSGEVVTTVLYPSRLDFGAYLLILSVCSPSLRAFLGCNRHVGARLL